MFRRGVEGAAPYNTSRKLQFIVLRLVDDAYEQGQAVVAGDDEQEGPVQGEVDLLLRGNRIIYNIGIAYIKQSKSYIKTKKHLIRGVFCYIVKIITLL